MLLDNLDMVTANDVDLKPIPSNNTKIMSFNVTCPQVWRHYINCLLFPFSKEITDLSEGQINDLLLGKHFLLPFLPATPLSPSQTLEGLFELTRRLSRALD